MISRQKSSYSLDSRFRGNDDSARSPVIPAYAGIQIRHSLKYAKTVLLNSLYLLFGIFIHSNTQVLQCYLLSKAVQFSPHQKSSGLRMNE